ncbi:helix-turn-helix domain-containing protein [Streptomyces sp. cg36]|uniref:helix-turn-helix domain-containing protein n=1 Tax=Streptomyces sp. cg36 TaxID=3238798 RepID=UPI0034E1F104
MITELRRLRDEAGLTVRQLAELTSYSISSLSQATSGRTLPRWELIKTYAANCGASDEQIAHLHRLWQTASNATAAPRRRAAVTPVQARIPRPRPGSHSSFADSVAPSHPHAGTPSEAGPPPAQPPHDEGDQLAALVSHAYSLAQAHGRDPSAPSTNPYTTALNLCTTADHFTALMQHMWTHSGKSLRDLVRSMRQAQVPVARSTLHAVLQGHRLPSTEVLHAFLNACSCPSTHWDLWHQTNTRIKIARLLARQERPVSRFARLRLDPVRRTALTYTTLLILVITQLIALLIQTSR